MTRRRTLLILALPLALLAGCGSEVPQRRAACETIQFEGSPFTICAARRGRHELRLVNLGHDGQPMREFDKLSSVLGDHTKDVAFAMNAGMFDESGRPIGLYVENGRKSKPLNRRSGGGNFHLLPNGVFYGDAQGWHVDTTEDFATRAPKGLFLATQSGPMLVIKGKLHPAFSENGSSLNRRNGVGVARDGTAWFAISDAPVSFGRFARLFRDRLDCGEALYFDGGVSRLWDPGAGREEAGAPLGPIVVALQSH